MERVKITMGLYWIAPTHFLNLDRRNARGTFMESGKMPLNLVNNLPIISGDKIPASKYFEMVDKLRGAFLSSEQSTFKNFMELSFEAWRYSEEFNLRIVMRKDKEKTKAKEGCFS